ncbi:hypothetical protein EDC22_102440 [Tepidamorphus gemmatus]|uniref:Uncharacterized protein n=1 Tax=Tepidamorphus gemmatus TaxID=747076 RepID=A0A4R3MK00_9HYPH|nr:hypothetical protein [Tepidamorphus gemmatus]TCT12754.1 hypothetical protein EDC22_102440 [Tepidamorphus gemmatus]
MALHRRIGLAGFAWVGGGPAVLPFGADMVGEAPCILGCYRLDRRDALNPARTQQLVAASVDGT